MTQYAVLIYEAVAPAELPPEVQHAHERLPGRIADRLSRPTEPTD